MSFYSVMTVARARVDSYLRSIYNVSCDGNVKSNVDKLRAECVE